MPQNPWPPIAQYERTKRPSTSRMDGPLSMTVLRLRPDSHAARALRGEDRRIGVTHSPVSGLRTTVRLSTGSSSTTEVFSSPK